MHIGLVCPEVPGHLNPITALGHALVERGHCVSFVAVPRVRARAERAGLGFLPIGEPEDADGTAAANWQALGESRGIAALRHTGRAVRSASLILQRDLPRAITAGRIDALVIDQFSPAGALAAEKLQVPYVVVCNALACHFDPVAPPPPLPWRYRDDWVARLRNRVAVPLLRTVMNRAAQAHLPGGVSPLELVFKLHYGRIQVAQQPEFFDFPAHRRPAHFHFTAPWHAQQRDDHLSFPWEQLDGRRLVYASLGTLQNKVRHVYEAIAQAAAGLEVQLVLALGDSDARLWFTPPPNVLVVPFAPQLRLLDRAAAAITHAGLNTALECLTRGVPMVCLPVTNDQPGVAGRVTWLGAGEMLPVHRASAPRIRRLLQQVLSESKYREAAARCRDQLAGRNGAAEAAELIERALVGGAQLLPGRPQSSTAGA